MALTDAMNTKKNNTVFHENERSFRLKKRVDYWSQVPEIGAGFANFDESTQYNLACNLDNQAGHMARLSENQVSTSFNGFTPENMLRLVRLAMPNVVRSKIFTEFAMETARDSIKYVRPVYSKTQNGKSLVDKTDDFNRLYEDADEFNDINNPNYRKAIYESTEDRIPQELANIDPVAKDGVVTFTFKALDVEAAKAKLAKATTAADQAAAKVEVEKAIASQKWEDGSKYIDGYGVVYFENERNIVAQQDKRTKKFFLNPDYAEYVKAVAVNEKNGVYSFEITLTEKGAATVGSGSDEAAFDADKLKAFARYDSEMDYKGDYLGEIEIKMSDYEFQPRPTTIGVTWSQLSEIVLDTSFSVSAQEYLVTYASQAIKMALDYRAIKTAYAAAKTNPKAYHVTFDAAYNTTNVGTNGGTKEGYTANAQTFLSAIATVGDNMLNDINRGGVSRLVAGPSAGTYMTLSMAFTTTGATTAEGAHQVGEISGIPVFKVPSSIIPSNEVLTVWKNPNNEADISIAFGTLVPFFSTGIIQRQNFYKEAGLATYGDWAIINKRYLALITIDNLKDSTVA